MPNTTPPKCKIPLQSPGLWSLQPLKSPTRFYEDPKFISKANDYGFIHGDDHVDYFLHVTDTATKSIPTVGTMVAFEVVQGKGGRTRAANVRFDEPVSDPWWGKGGELL